MLLPIPASPTAQPTMESTAMVMNTESQEGARQDGGMAARR